MKMFNCLLILGVLTQNSFAKYEPNWDSIDSRPLPRWYDEVKLGIFIVWGVYSVPSYGDEWFWYNWKSGSADHVKFMKDQYPPSFTYQDFAKDFDAYMFDPFWWAELVKDSGAKYVVFTSKHHDGYTLWPSNVSFSWNSKDVGPNLDLVGDLATALRNSTDVHFGLYHSLFEWYNPLHGEDKANNFQTNRFVTQKTMPELFELVETYKPDVIWSDGDWNVPDTYWNSTGFLAWLYNESPVKDTVAVNDRWGDGAACHHGGYWTCTDRYNPGTLVSHKWENAYTLDKASWGFRRDAVLHDYLTELEIVTTLSQTVSCGGNLLLNMGPRKDGRIDPIMEERLRQLGKWLRVNGESIYESQPWLFQNETDIPVWYTAKKSKTDGAITVYAIVLAWPKNDLLFLRRVSPTKQTQVTMLGYNVAPLKWQPLSDEKQGILIDFSSIAFGDIPSTVAWVVKLERLAKKQQQIHPLVVKNYLLQ